MLLAKVVCKKQEQEVVIKYIKHLNRNMSDSVGIDEIESITYGCDVCV